jgi:serine/threonine protein kinase
MHFDAGGRNYRLGGVIGDGAAGIVRKGTDLASGDQVAIKLLAPDAKYIDRRAFDDVAQRFRREGIRGAGLDYENLVKIIAYEENLEGSAFQSGDVFNPFIVMEYIPGRTLESLPPSRLRDHERTPESGPYDRKA